MTKHARRGCKLGGDVVQLSFQLGDFGMTQRLTTQAAEVVFEEEVELPGQFRFVKRQTTCDRLCFVSAFSRLLNLRDQCDRLFLVLVALLFRLFVVNLKNCRSPRSSCTMIPALPSTA